MEKQTLKQLGLSSEEIKLYQKLLEIGKTSAGKLIESTNLKRGTVYNYLDSLVGKGLVVKKQGEKKLYFEPQSPDKLRDLLNSKKDQIKSIETNLDNLIPTLKSKFNLAVEKPVIRYFEGKEGIKQIYKDTLKDTKLIKVIRSIYDDKEFSQYLNTYYAPKRARLGIKTKIISQLQGEHEIVSHDKELLKRRKTIKEEDFPAPTEIDIYGDKVAMISFKRKLVGIIIENKDVAETMEHIFNQLWQKLD
jgi:sugar-specific transcriptional regulator TrmB